MASDGHKRLYGSCEMRYELPPSPSSLTQTPSLPLPLINTLPLPLIHILPLPLVHTLPLPLIDHDPSSPLIHTLPPRSRSQVRRVSPSDLYEIVRPPTTALLFDRAWITPWRAYLARYPEVPVVVVLDDPKVYHAANANRKKRYMRAEALQGVRGWRIAFSTTLHVHEGPPIACVAYERVL